MLELEHNLSYYENCFCHLKMARTRGQVAPHKPLLLLAVIDLIEARIISSPQIELSKELIDAFERNSQRYAIGENYKPNIGMPFFHMKSEPFWRLVPKSDGFKPGVTTISGLRRYYDYAEIDHELFGLLKKADNISALRKTLIETLSRKAYMERPSLNKIYASLDVLRKIGVEPSKSQLILLSQFEEELLQQAAKDFISKVNEVHRPFVLNLEYKPGKESIPTIKIDDKVLPIALPKVTSAEIVPEKQQMSKQVDSIHIQQQMVAEDEPTHKVGNLEKPQIPVRPVPQIEKAKTIAPEPQPQSEEKQKPSPADDFFSSLYDTPVEDNKPKRTRQKYSLNGSRFMKKEELVFEIIKLYIKHHPKATFRELKQVFSDDFCSNKFRSIGFLVSEEDLDDWYYNGKYSFYHGDDPDSRFESADGIGFFHYAQWTHESLIPIIELAESIGYRITTDKD